MYSLKENYFIYLEWNSNVLTVDDPMTVPSPQTLDSFLER